MNKSIEEDYNGETFNEGLLIDCDFLTHNSIVFDIGANVGIWTENIYNKYHPQIYCFEPASSSFNLLEQKFKDNNDIRLYKFGLGSTNRDIYLFTTNEKGGDVSEFLEKKRQRLLSNNNIAIEKCIVKEFIQFIKDNNIDNIDLLAINCEGCEYDLLNHLLNTKYISNIKNILIQFHTPENGVIIDKWEEKIKLIRNGLEITHIQIWNSPGYFEMWSKRI